MSEPYPYTAEQKRWIIDNIAGTPIHTLNEMFNEKFNADINYENFRGLCKRLKVKNGLKGGFAKGHTGYNKGKKCKDFISPEKYEAFRKSRYQSGHIPLNSVPVGTENIVNGYYKVKIGEPNIWKYKHRLVWEQAYGDIPKDKIIRFLDGDTLNCSLDNLMLVSRAGSAKTVRIKSYGKNSEINKTILLICELENKINNNK